MRLVANLEGQWYRRSELADLLGRTRAAIHQAGKRHPELAAKHYTQMGAQPIDLYTPDEVEALRTYFGTTRAGRPALWNAVERPGRQRATERARWHRRRAKKLSDQGKPLAAMKSARLAGELARELAKDAATRA